MFPLAENVGRAGLPLSGNRVSFRGARGSRGSRGLGASGGTADADAESKFCQSHFCPEPIFRSRIARGENVNQARRRRNEKNEKSEWRKRKPQQRKSTKNPRKKRKIGIVKKEATARRSFKKTQQLRTKLWSSQGWTPIGRKINATNPGPRKILEETKKTKNFRGPRKIHEKSQITSRKPTKKKNSC